MSEFNLEHLSIEELVQRRNADCMHSGWVGRRGLFHWELREAFRKYGFETDHFNLHTYIAYENGELVRCERPRYRFRAIQLNDRIYFGLNVLKLTLSQVDLSKIITPKIIRFEEERSASLELSDSTKRFQLVSLDSNYLVTGVSVLIGHSGHRFVQQVYGMTILILPFEGGQEDRIALGQVIHIEDHVAT